MGGVNAASDQVMALADIVRSERNRQGLSQVRLAAKAGVARSFLSELENGHSRAEVGKVLSVLQALSVGTRYETLYVDESTELDRHLAAYGSPSFPETTDVDEVMDVTRTMPGFFTSCADVARALRLRRALMGLTLQEVAMAAGLTEAQVIATEEGSRYFLAEIVPLLPVLNIELLGLPPQAVDGESVDIDILLEEHGQGPAPIFEEQGRNSAYA